MKPCLYFQELYISKRRICAEEATTEVLSYGAAKPTPVCPQHARRVLAANRSLTAHIIRDEQNARGL
jgi:hypothetical protein